jgi:hypothetical protein
MAICLKVLSWKSSGLNKKNYESLDNSPTVTSTRFIYITGQMHCLQTELLSIVVVVLVVLV